MEHKNKLFSVDLNGILYAIVLLLGFGVMWGSLNDKVIAQGTDIDALKADYKSVPATLATVVQKLNDLSKQVDSMDRYNRGQKRSN